MSEAVQTGEIVDPLSNEEFDDLDRLETDVARGMTAMFTAGAALAEINTRRLYRARHSSFADYCEKQWQIDRSRAYQLIAAAEVVEELSTIVDTPLPTNEGQARALAPLKGHPEKMAEAMHNAHEATGGKATAKAIEAEARKLAPPKPPPPAKPTETAEQARARTAAEYEAKQQAIRDADVLARANADRLNEDEQARGEAANAEVRKAVSRLLELDPIATGPYCPDPDRRLRRLAAVEQWCADHRAALTSEGVSLTVINGGA